MFDNVNTIFGGGVRNSDFGGSRNIFDGNFLTCRDTFSGISIRWSAQNITVDIGHSSAVCSVLLDKRLA